MRAMLLHQPGGQVTLAEVDEPRVGPGDAKIKVRAAGVGLTIVIMKGTPGLVTSFPRILGHEVAGEVVELGSEVRHLKLGDHVVCHFYLTCGVCGFCRSGRETLCQNWRGYVGMACDGGYAEYMSVPAVNLCRIPDDMPFAEASIISDAIATPLHACRVEAKVGPGDDVLVVGAGGGVGIHAVQIAKLCGGRVIAADLSAEKLECAKALGADEIIDCKAKDLATEVRKLSDGRGVDAVLDFVASAQTLEAGFQSLAVAGRLVILGFQPAAVFKRDPTFRVDPVEVMRKMLEIHGSRYVTMAELLDAVKIVHQGKIKPVISRTFPLEEAELAHSLIQSNQITGRAALII
ncbi:MAG: zinc-binding dehydrogenase [Candidatus Korobacteraceae bacterium]